MGAQYTPTPWAVADGPEIYSVPAYRSVAMALADGNEDANAAFIVRACNSFDDLVAALSFNVSICANTCHQVDRQTAGEMYEMARAALAKAEAAQ